MKATAGNRINRVLDEILDVLARWGEVTITSHFAGKTFQVRVQDGDGGVRSARPVARGDEPPLPTADAVFALIAAKPVGLGLEDLAAALDVRPRNRLKPVLAGLVRAGQVIKAGRRFRSASAVVRRGRVPNALKAARRSAPAAKPAKRRGRPALAAKKGAAGKVARRPGHPAKGTEKAAESAPVALAEGPVIRSKTRGKKTRVVKDSRSGMRRARLADGATPAEPLEQPESTTGIGSEDRPE